MPWSKFVSFKKNPNVQNQNSQFELFSKSNHNYRWLIVLIVILISVVTIINAAQLQQAIERKTRSYVNDVSFQVSQNIDYQLKKLSLDMEILADSLNRYQNHIEKMEYLKGKQEKLGFTALALADLNGKSYDTTGSQNTLKDLEAFDQAVAGGHGVSILNEQSILYTVPIYENNVITGVLAGLRNKENMQNLIKSESFNGRALSCIIDQNAKVIISPTDLELFLMLDDIFLEEKDDILAKEIEQMQQDMLNHVDGDISFTSANGDKVLMSYNVLDSYNWVLLTLIPSNILSSETDQYVLFSFIIIALTMLIFALILAQMFYIYRSSQQKLERVAFIDPITEGMNHIKFRQECYRLFQHAEPAVYSIVSLNIRNFKLINENFGSNMGNHTLRYIMRVLEKNITMEERAARGEADNFYLCLKEHDLISIQQRLDQMIGQINSFNDNLVTPYYLTILQGAYLVDDLSLDVTVMQDRANIARKSKFQEKDNACMFYSSIVMEQLQREKEYIDTLDYSLKKGEFKVYLQPKIRLSDQKIGGAEALIRWNHPQKGLIPPLEFIPVFEKSGAICKLDLYIFKEICALIQRWNSQGFPLFPISVNLSRQHFKQTDFLNEFDAIHRAYQIPERMIEMELTESIIFDGEEIRDVKEVIHQMHKMGFLCSLDDFGFGYSSLGLLKEFDVDTVKLDRCFFVDESQSRAEDVVESIIGLLKKLNITTVAEGIETIKQTEFLKRVHCDMVQGYVYSKPLPVTEFEQWMKNWNEKHGV
jgi:diguanylate cyclase (GGDEF)-like protein